jgi:hypothetical protein
LRSSRLQSVPVSIRPASALTVPSCPALVCSRRRRQNTNVHRHSVHASLDGWSGPDLIDVKPHSVRHARREVSRVSLGCRKVSLPISAPHTPIPTPHPPAHSPTPAGPSPQALPRESNYPRPLRSGCVGTYPIHPKSAKCATGSAVFSSANGCNHTEIGLN